MPLNHSAHVYITPCYITTPTRHDYVHAIPWFNLALSLSLNSWLTKLQVLFIVPEGNLLRSGLTSQLAEPILSAESARSLGWARLRLRDSVQTSLTLSEQHLFELHS